MTVQRTLDQKELESLPTSARNFTQLLVIEPGVSADISELLSNDNASISPSVNGARTTNNSFVFNGMDVTNLLCCNSRVNGSSGTIENGGGSLSRNVAPAPETLQEVKLQTSLYDAGTGRNGGGNFTLVGKSGTNSFRGSAYYYNQNDGLMANDFFFNRAGIEKPILDRHEGGGTIGGPIIREQDVLLRLVPAHAGRDVVRGRGEQYGAAAESAHRRSVRCGHQRLRGRHLGSHPRAGELQRHQPDLAGAAEGHSSPTARTSSRRADGGINCRRSGTQLFESCQVVSVIPATFEQDQFTTNVDHQLTTAQPVQREVLLLQPAEPRPARQRQRADAARARGHDLPADVLVHRPPHLQPHGASTSSAPGSSATGTTAIRSPTSRTRSSGSRTRSTRRCPISRRSPSAGTATSEVSCGWEHWPTARASTTSRRPTPSGTR